MLSAITKALLLLQLAGASAFAQTTMVRTDFTQFGGLNDVDAPATISKVQAQEALNVEANVGATAIKKRAGLTTQQTLSIATAPVLGSFRFKNNSGDQIDIVCQNRNCSKSTNQSAFTVFHSTAASGLRYWTFTSANGKGYGANDQHDNAFSYDGTTFRTPFIAASSGSIVYALPARMVMANFSAFPGQTCYSIKGNFEDFTQGTDDEDAWCDQVGTAGEAITGVAFFKGILWYFKTRSIVQCLIDNQYNSSCETYTNAIGAEEPTGIVATPDGVYFKSSEKGFWKIGNDGMKLISQQIYNTIASQASGRTENHLEDSQADWQAGLQTPLTTWNTTSLPGSIFPSTVVFTLNGIRTTDWFMIDASTSDPVISPHVSNNDGNTTTLDTMWTLRDGAMVNSGHSITGSQTGFAVDSVSAPNSTSTGVWSFVYFSSSASSYMDFWFVASDTRTTGGGGDYGKSYWFALGPPNGTFTIQLGKVSGPTLTMLNSSSGTLNYNNSVARTFMITRSTEGFMAVYEDGVFVLSAQDTEVKGSTYTNIRITQGASKSHISNVKFPGVYTYQRSTATYALGLSTVSIIPGPFTASLSSSSISSVTFRTTYATAPLAGFTSYFLQTPGQPVSVPTISSMPFFKYQIVVTAPSSTYTALSVTSESLMFASTGQFRTQCIQPNIGISAWGNLTCAETTGSGGSLVYYATSAASCALLPSGAPSTWQTSVTNGSTLSISTNAALYLGFKAVLSGSATGQAQVDACNLAYTQGTPAPPTWGVYDSLGEAIFWTVATDSSTSNNKVLKYDMKIGQWFPWSMYVNAPLMSGGELFFGGSTAGKWYRYGLADSDDGANINSYWRTYDISSSNPYQERIPIDVSVIARNEQIGSINVDWYNGRGSSGTYTVSTSTTSTIPYVRRNYLLPVQTASSFFSIRIGNNSTTPWEVFGIRLNAKEEGWRVLTP